MVKANVDVNLVDLTTEFKQVIYELERELGREVIVTSGYRGPNHPIEASKTNGPGVHSEGVAIDVAAVGGTAVFEIVSAAIKVGIKRIGINRRNHFVHLDCADKVTSIWTY